MLLGVALGGLFLTVIVMLSITVLGIDQSANGVYPTYALAKSINIGNFLQRMEAILLALWTITFFIKMTLMYFAMLLGLKTLLQIKEPLTMHLPVAVIFLVVAWNTFINSSHSAIVSQEVWAGYSVIQLVIFPVLLLAVWWVRKRFANQSIEK